MHVIVIDMFQSNFFLLPLSIAYFVFFLLLYVIYFAVKAFVLGILTELWFKNFDFFGFKVYIGA